MLLSFSVPEMRPWVVSGLIQRAAPPGYVDDGRRVKRQTIRQRGPRAEALLKQAIKGKHPGALHMWWKSRTKERDRLGTATGFEIVSVVIRHDRETVMVEVEDVGPVFFGSEQFEAFAYADGFDSAEAFRDYFVPNVGDRFDGVLFRW